MLYCAPAKKRNITEIEKRSDRISFVSEYGCEEISVYAPGIVRVRFTQRDSFSQETKDTILLRERSSNFTFGEKDAYYEIATELVNIRISKETGSLSFYDPKGKLYVKERERDSKILEEFQSFVPYEGEKAKTEIVKTADGEKEIVREVARIPGERFYHTRLHLDFSKGEALYGLGQNEEELLNLRGQVVYVHQANRKIAVPMLVSQRKYGILVNTNSPMIFNDTVGGSYIYTEADRELDYFFLAGNSMMEVNKAYRQLTGKAAMLPKWSFGYIQSQERYETAEEIVRIAREHRDRNIGIDCIVLDWCSWEDGMWGQKSFDPGRFENPAEMIEQLHAMDVKFMISIWPNMAKGTANNEEMEREKGLLFASDIYNSLDSHARDIYWKQVESKLFCHGVDAWWCDSSEPLTVEWVHPERMEPSLLYGEYCRELQNRLPVTDMNIFPFYHAMTLYEGQRRVCREKRVCNLTRSAYTGQQRFGTILWSGDTSASWETLKSQIPAGLNFVSSGLPYWTVDIGAFFVKPGNFWYWDGRYKDTNQDEGYLELYTRWYQWATFLPVFRGHGTDVRRELWEFKGCEGMFYEACMKFNRLRYALMPYIYSQAGKVWLNDDMMIKPLVYDYSEDPKVFDCKDQYMFGDSLMICPVTEPFYYEADHRELHVEQKGRKVYLPAGEGFYDFWTKEYYEGGVEIWVEAPIDRIPVFVKEGSILPLLQESDRVSMENPKEERKHISFQVYANGDAAFSLYQDMGDGYGYEQGEYEVTEYRWSHKEKLLKQGNITIDRVEFFERK